MQPATEVGAELVRSKLLKHDRSSFLKPITTIDLSSSNVPDEILSSVVIVAVVFPDIL